MGPTAIGDPPELDSLETCSDAQLLERSVEEPRCFEHVYERHRSTVMRYLAARVGVEAADDIVSDTFLSAFQVRHKFNSATGTDALPWLLGIATRRLGRHRDAERQWLRARAAETADGHDQSSEHGDRIDSQVDASRLAKPIAGVLALLSRRERDPLLLHVLAGLSYDEIAVALDLAPGTVRSRISRARTRLAQLLDGVER